MHSVEQFAALFKDEREVREKLAQMLRNVSGYQGVRITHGTAEFGKDVIFYSSDPIQGFSLNACVVKKDKITGDVSSNQGARTVFLQAEQALDTARIADDGREEYPSTVYIVSPYECSEAAMLSIRGALASRRGSIQFLCGEKLLRMFEQFHPTGLIFDSTFLGSYVTKLRSDLLRSDPVSFLMEQNDLIASGLKQFESVYVKQDFRKILRVYEFTRALQPPTVNWDALDISGYSSVIEWLELITPVVSEGQAWDDPDPSLVSDLSGRLLTLANELTDDWEKMWTETYGVIPARGSWNDKHTIRMPRSIVQRFDRETIPVRTLINGLAKSLETTNTYVRSLGKNFRLGTPECLAYCRMEEITKKFSDIFSSHGKVVDTVLTRTTVEKSAEPLLITAAAGHGKTSFCKWRVLECIQSLESKTSDIVPFYIPLHQHATQEVGTDALKTFLNDASIISFFKELCASDVRIHMFFDGLDEVTTLAKQCDLMKAAKKIGKEHPNVSIVVTARDHVHGSWLRWLSRVELSELTDEQVEELVGKWLGCESEDYYSFFQQLDQSRSLYPLTRVPLLCTLILAVFRRNRALPQSRARLYEIVVDLMCGGWDLAKNVRRNLRFGSDQKREVLTRFAGIVHMNRRREGTEREFSLAVQDVSPSSKFAWRDLLGEVLEDGLIASAGGALAFSHLSFQEYLAAVDLRDPFGHRPKTALRAYLRGDDWWAEALVFYLSRTSRPAEMKRWVESEALKTQGRRIQEGRISRLFEAFPII